MPNLKLIGAVNGKIKKTTLFAFLGNSEFNGFFQY